ncbi:sigma-70 family RNA polymerase sigma factor [Nonomuraea sp. NPDC050451]|uniref:sigma-70 family RNA polymerase sigma factor n=1 Tax=Nonomuraea sp. NPDC050451 TaxID=3364364 RepID=UPI0037A013C3
MTESTIEDTALTRLVRAGDSRAIAELHERHHAAVLALARRLCPDPQTAEDLASEAFVRTLRTVRSGTAGPEGPWRPYLYAVVRNTAAEWARRDQRLVLTPEFGEDALTAEAPEPPDHLVARAYRSLPPRWQTVLWHTLIEEETPEQVAQILGITTGNVNVLAFRAREGLRKAYLAAHMAGASPECRVYAEPLAAAVRRKTGWLPRSLRAHLVSCPSCTQAYGELLDLNTTLRAALPIWVLPLAMGAVGKAKGLSAGGLGWVIPASITTAVAATAAVVLMALPPDPSPPAAAQPTLKSSASPVPTPKPKKTQIPTPEPTKTPKPTPTPTRKPTPRAVPGTRIVHAGRCVGVISGQIAAPACTDARTAWRTQGEPQGFQLVNIVSGLCLTAGEKYDDVAFNGGGMRAVRLSRCSDAPAQRWHRPIFSDGVPRLISVSSGMAFSIGKEFAGKRPPTAFILYGAYTESLDQQIAFASTRG